MERELAELLSKHGVTRAVVAVYRENIGDARVETVSLNIGWIEALGLLSVAGGQLMSKARM